MVAAAIAYLGSDDATTSTAPTSASTAPPTREVLLLGHLRPDRRARRRWPRPATSRAGTPSPCPTTSSTRSRPGRTYPYTKDGARRWEMGTPWPDPWVTIGHLAGRHRAAALRHHRVHPPGPHARSTSPSRSARRRCCPATGSTLGIGMGWMEEEFDAMGTPVRASGASGPTRCSRCMRKLWTGEVVEHHGEHFDFAAARDAARRPTEPVPDLRRRRVGGRAAPGRPQRRLDQRPPHHRGAGRDPRADRAATARSTAATHLPFAMYGSARDAWDLDGYRRARTTPASPTSSRCPGTSTPAPTPTWPARSTASSASPTTSSPSGDARRQSTRSSAGAGRGVIAARAAGAPSPDQSAAAIWASLRRPNTIRMSS